jgi:hypothetical protein
LLGLLVGLGVLLGRILLRVLVFAHARSPFLVVCFWELDLAEAASDRYANLSSWQGSCSFVVPTQEQRQSASQAASSKMVRSMQKGKLRGLRIGLGTEVRIAAPHAAEEEMRDFAPHLLVRNDTDGLEEAGLLAGIPCRVEVLYSDSMDAKISVDGRVEEVRDMSTEELLRVADRAASIAR